MAYKVLYRKYRPDDFSNVVGQDYTVEMLKNAIITGKNAHAYIFTGPRGTGKTSSAKIFAKALNCEHPIDGNPCNECESCLSFKENPDIIEIDAASNNGVDEIRELINNVKLVPSRSKFKVYVIDEVHMLTASAFNALLLTLEEPPQHVVFILATTDIQDVPITILSRCQRFDFKPVSKSAIIHRMKYICEQESINITDEALEEIALISAGGMRDALGMLDQLSSDEKEITLDLVSSYFGSVSSKKINELLTTIEESDTEKFGEIISDIRESGTNYSVFVEKLIQELRKSAIGIKSGKYIHNFSFDQIYNMIFDLNECLSNLNINVNPYILIEIVLLKYMNSGNNYSSNVVLGNNLETNSISVGNNSVISTKEKKKSSSSAKNDAKKDEPVIFDGVINSIDIYTRINNCFVDASKEFKSQLISNWVGFMNYLLNNDRNLLNLITDTNVLAASDTYALIQHSVDSTNDLINSRIKDLEALYEKFAGNKIKFASVQDKIWKKEVEKYRFNLQNKIKYSYIDEQDEDIDSDLVNDLKDKDIESVAKDIFGSFEVE